MTITWQTPGAIAYSTGTQIAPAYPAGCVEGEKLLLIIGQKPMTANSGGVVTPTDWSLVTSIIGAGGYSTTLGIDTGNTNLFVFERTVPAGGLSGSLIVDFGSNINNISWAIILRLTSTNGSWGTIAGATGSDTASGSVSIAFSSNPGVTAGDFIVGAMCIPTDVTTPSQFSAEAFTQSGVTFGTVTEVGEPDNSGNNDIGGFICRATVSSGTATGNPTMTATAGGTTTNVRGPGVFIRIREGAKIAYGDVSISTVLDITTSAKKSVGDGISINLASEVVVTGGRWRGGGFTIESSISNTSDGVKKSLGEFIITNDTAQMVSGNKKAAGNILLLTAVDVSITSNKLSTGAFDIFGQYLMQYTGVKKSYTDIGVSLHYSQDMSGTKKCISSLIGETFTINESTSGVKKGGSNISVGGSLNTEYSGNKKAVSQFSHSMIGGITIDASKSASGGFYTHIIPDIVVDCVKRAFGQLGVFFDTEIEVTGVVVDDSLFYLIDIPVTVDNVEDITCVISSVNDVIAQIVNEDISSYIDSINYIAVFKE